MYRVTTLRRCSRVSVRLHHVGALSAISPRDVHCNTAIQSPYSSPFDTRVTLQTPDYVTLFSGTSSDDVQTWLTHEDALSSTRLHGPARSLTVCHIPTARDVDHRDNLAMAIHILFKSYASRCHISSVTCLILATVPSVADLSIAWRWLSTLSELQELHINDPLSAKDITVLSRWLVRNDSNCPRLEDVRFRTVTRLQDVNMQVIEQLLDCIHRITQPRTRLRWTPLDGRLMSGRASINAT